MRTKRSVSRREFLRGAVVLGGGVVLASCAPPAPAPTATPAPAAPPPAPAVTGPLDLPEFGIQVAAEAVDPLNIEKGITVDGVFFEGGYGADYIRYAAKIFEAVHPDVKVNVVGIQRVGDQLRPRFIAGNPPDVIDNSGAGNLDTVALAQEGQLLDLEELMRAPALDTPGKTFAETLFLGSQDSHVYDGKQLALNIAYTVVGIWHSQSLFEKKGWEYPKTWDDHLAFCEMVKNEGEMSPWTYQGKYPGYMVWGLWHPLIYKIGGQQPTINLDNLEPGCFDQPEVAEATELCYELAVKGYIMPGTEGLTHTEAQAEWLNGKAVFVPCGSWLENEMKTVTPAGFDMVVKPVPAVAGGKGTYEGLMTAAGETYLVPSKAQHPRAGMEFLRMLLSKASARFFAEQVSSMMPVIGATEEALLSAGMKSAVAAAEAAGSDTFPFPFWGGVSEVNTEMTNLMGELLTNRIKPADLLKTMRETVEAALSDPDIKVIKRR